MTKTELLLASTALSVLVLWHPQSAAAQASYGSIVVAQEQPRGEDQRKHPGQQKGRAVQPGQPAAQPAQSPAAQGQPAQPGQPQAPTVVQPGQPPAQPGRPKGRAVQPGQPAAQPTQPPAAQGQPAQPGQPQAPAVVQPGQPPAQPGRPKGRAVQPGQPPAQPTQPPAAQGQPAQPGQPQAPAVVQPGQPPAQPGRPKGRAVQPGQPPAQPTQPPAAQGQPAQPGQPQAPAVVQPGQPPAQPGRPKGGAVQPGQPPAQPTQPPAAQGQPAQPGRPQAPTVVQPGQPPAQPAQPPAARAPVPPPPVAQGQPPQPAQGHVPAPVNAQGQPIRRVEGLRSERREEREGDRIVIREPDRVIVREGGRTIIRHNETDRFRYGARDIRIERRGSENFTIVERPGGVRIVTVTNEDGRLIRRIRRYPDGREVVIIENRWRPGIGVAAGVAGIAAATFFLDLPPPRVHIPRRSYIIETEGATPEEIYGVLMAPPIERLERPYSLEEIRYNAPLRARMPSVDIDTITFEMGSWEVSPDQGNRLSVIAQSINRGIETNPSEVFLIEGHTDAVGNEVDNLSLSDRRAEAVALILTEQFQVPPENLTTQGYGEQHLKVPTEGPELANRRVTARRITPLLSGDPGSAGQRAN